MKPLSTSQNHILWLCSLLGFAVIILYTGLGSIPLIDWDENIYAEASRQMVLRGDYLNVYVNDHPFAEKPPFFFWEQSLSYHLFGINEFAARFPSTIASLVMLVLFFFLGRRLVSTTFGGLWALIYLTSFLPLLLARTSIIDHTFNTFITIATFSLYGYDLHYQKARSQQQSPKNHWQLLTLASISMGLACLTKGPLGGVIPLFAFTCYKIQWHMFFQKLPGPLGRTCEERTPPHPDAPGAVSETHSQWYRLPSISLLHLIYCGTLSLSIALSWYIINGLIHGQSFLAGFIEFQLALFSKPLEGHEGPFVYHWLILIIGLFPWSPFLLAFRRRFLHTDNPHIQPLFAMSLGWVLGVLFLFSMVSTKLPHYSASMYIPLSFIVSWILYRYYESQHSLPRWVLIIFIGLGLSIASVFMALPQLIASSASNQPWLLELEWSNYAFFTGASLGLGVLIATVLFWKQRLLPGIITTALAGALFMQGLWHFQLPPLIAGTQQPVIELVQEAHRKQGQVVFYRYVSFAALFYGKQPIEMLHTYKFPNDPSILNQAPSTQDLWVITERKNRKKLQKTHPLLQHQKDHGAFSLLILSSE